MLTIPVDADELVFAWKLFGGAADGNIPTENPSKNPIRVELDPGEEVEIRLTDHPLNRGMLALAEHFGKEDKRKYTAVSARMFALFQIIERVLPLKEMEGAYVRQTSDGPAFHPAFFDVAASMPLDPDEGFVLEDFIARLKALEVA